MGDIKGKVKIPPEHSLAEAVVSNYGQEVAEWRDTRVGDNGTTCQSLPKDGWRGLLRMYRGHW